MKIVFVGGGSLGPVTPLLALGRALHRRDTRIEFAWIGTPQGPERALVEAAGMSFHALSVAKWPRYPSFQWLTFPFRALHARLEAGRLIRRLMPSAVVSMGGFTALPIVRAAAYKGIPCFTHQLDLEPGLTNRLIAQNCVSVTTSFEYEQRPFGERINDEPAPTPVRYERHHQPARTAAARHFGLDPDAHTILVYGGGQGAQALNESIQRTLKSWLTWTQVLHVTGPGKSNHRFEVGRGYIQRELLNERDMSFAHALADLEIIRGGIGALSEVAALEKAAIVVPMPGSHQEANAHAFEEQGAIVRVDQDSATFDVDLFAAAKLLLQDAAERQAMGKRAHHFFPTDDGRALADRVLRYLKKSSHTHTPR